MPSPTRPREDEIAVSSAPFQPGASVKKRRTTNNGQNDDSSQSASAFEEELKILEEAKNTERGKYIRHGFILNGARFTNNNLLAS